MYSRLSCFTLVLPVFSVVRFRLDYLRFSGTFDEQICRTLWKISTISRRCHRIMHARVAIKTVVTFMHGISWNIRRVVLWVWNRRAVHAWNWFEVIRRIWTETVLQRRRWSCDGLLCLVCVEGIVAGHAVITRSILLTTIGSIQGILLIRVLVMMVTVDHVVTF